MSLHTLYLSLGSNLGDRKQNLNDAIRLIAQRIGTIAAESSVFETEPWGFQSPNAFCNMAIRVETEMPPLDVLSVTREIEITIGRTEKSNHSYQDRVIDIDLILYENLIIETDELKLPHPLFHLRKFVLQPLCEIDGGIIHPIFNKKISSFLI